MSKKRTKSLPPQQQVQQLPYTTTQSSPNNNNNTTRDVSTLSSSNIAASQVFMNTTHSPIASSSSDQLLPSMIPSFSSPIPIQTITSNNTIGTGVTSPLGSSQQHASSSPRIHSLLNHHHTSPRGGTVPPTTTTTLSNSSSSLSSSETPMIHSPLFMNQQQQQYLETNQIPSPQKSIHSFSQLQQQQQPSTTTSKNLTPPSAISSLSLDTILRNATNELKQLNSTLATAIPTKPLTFSDLPNDLLHYILCFLELKDFLSCRLTNRVFHILAENEWQRHYRAVWEVPHRLVFWDIDTPIVSSRQSFLIGAPILHSALTLTPQNHVNNTTLTTTTTTTHTTMTTTSTTTTTTTAGATSSDHILNTTTTSSNSNHSTTSAARFSRIHHHYNGNMVTSSQRKTMFFPTPPHHHSSMSSILDYNNPWKDLFIERYRIIHGSNASSKRKLGIFSSRRETSSEDYVEKGYRYVYRNEYSKAIHYFEKAISLSKEGSCARAWEGLAKICWIRDLPQYVIVYAEEALKNNPVNPGELFFIRGKALLKLNRIVEALPDLTKAVNFLTMSPVNYHLFLKISEVYYERMMCHIELGNIDQALADGETIMTTDKCFETDCFFKAAKILYEKQHYDDAEKFMSSSYVKKTPEYYLLNLQIKSANGCYPQALENLKKFEELEAKKRSNTFNNSATVLTKESLIDIGIVLLMNDCINEAVEYFTKGALLRSTAASQTNNTASPPSSSSDDLIFNSLMRRSSLSFAFSSHKVIDEEATRRAKLFVIDAAQRQKTEYSSYFGVDLNGSSYFDIHMAWSYYYYLLAMLYYCRNTITFNGVEKGRYSATFSTRSTATQLMSLTSHNQNDEMGSSARLILLIKGQKNYIYQQRKLSIRFVNENLENDLKHSITNLTRAITLNPTLCEGFYYRSLMKCFLQIDNHLVAICSSPMFGSTLTQNGIVSFLIEKFKKKKSPQKDAITDYKRHKKMHKNISDKINVVTNMRESLNDCENAFTLITMELRINTVDELEEIDFKSNSDISTIDLSTKSRKHTELLVDILLLRAFLFYSFGKKAECTECTNLACYLCHSASASSTPSENAENCPSNATPSTTSTNLASPSQIEENSQQETDHILLESITFERQLLACQGLFALNEDFEALKEIHPRFLTMRNDAIQRHVDQLIMNFIIEPEYSYVSQQLDYMLVIIHSQLLQKDLQNNSSSDHP